MMWDETGLSDLQAQLAHEMLSRVSAITLEKQVWLVRGVVNAPERRGVGRVVLWDGRRLDASVAFDMPLTDPEGANIPSGDLAAALRSAVAGCSEQDVEQAPRDAFGIPVIDASATVHAFVAQPQFHLSDALLAAGAAFSIRPESDEPAELRLRGFLLLDQATCRLYLDTPTSQDTLPSGFDLPLRDEEGSVVAGATGAQAVLPMLLEMGEIERLRKDVHDPYCLAVYDLAGWLTGR
ncbi:hypothetical protein AB0I54_08490 [Streptomyces sp. NPDC050625]|uniref:hypothetical protein n=1 Tax=Streptomyces sp. NPDC050625 TaxID=3154629 RepID=UPI003421B767